MNYATPPQSGLDIFHITELVLEDLKTSDLIAGKWVSRTLGLPKKYVEGIFELANVSSKKIGKDFSEDEIKEVLHTTKTIVTNVTTGNHDPVIIRNEKTEVIPIKLGKIDEKCSSVNSFMEGLDTVFTENIVEKGRTAQTGESDKKIKDLETQLSEQEKAIETVKEKSNYITNLANSLYEMVSRGIVSIEDTNAQGILAEHKAKLSKEKGISLIIVRDEKIKINPEASLQSIASVLFNEAKRQSGAIKSIEQIKIKTKKRLEKLKNNSETTKQQIQESQNDITYLESIHENFFIGMNVFRTAKGGRNKIKV